MLPLPRSQFPLRELRRLRQLLHQSREARPSVKVGRIVEKTALVAVVAGEDAVAAAGVVVLKRTERRLLPVRSRAVTKARGGMLLADRAMELLGEQQ